MWDTLLYSLCSNYIDPHWLADRVETSILNFFFKIQRDISIFSTVWDVIEEVRFQASDQSMNISIVYRRVILLKGETRRTENKTRVKTPGIQKSL